MSALLDCIAQRIGACAGEDAGVSAVFKFDAGQDGVLVLDTTAKSATVSTTDRAADCTMKIAAPFLMMAVDGRVPELSAHVAPLAVLRQGCDRDVPEQAGKLARQA